jgi:putative transposon-encoded protein
MQSPITSWPAGPDDPSCHYSKIGQFRQPKPSEISHKLFPTAEGLCPMVIVPQRYVGHKLCSIGLGGRRRLSSVAAVNVRPSLISDD